MKALEIIDFSKHLMRRLPRPLLVICGRLPDHDSVDVRAFVAAQRGRLMLEWLPGYAPELNPVEHLWAHLQNHEDSEPLPRDLLGAEHRGSRALRRMRRRPTLVTAFSCSSCHYVL